jgi:hypothetical protein
MTECLGPPDPHPGLVDRIAAWLFPGLYPNAIGSGMTESEFWRIQAAAAAEGNMVLIDTRLIPDSGRPGRSCLIPDPEAEAGS